MLWASNGPGQHQKKTEVCYLPHMLATFSFEGLASLGIFASLGKEEKEEKTRVGVLMILIRDHTEGKRKAHVAHSTKSTNFMKIQIYPRFACQNHPPTLKISKELHGNPWLYYGNLILVGNGHFLKTQLHASAHVCTEPHTYTSANNTQPVHAVQHTEALGIRR